MTNCKTCFKPNRSWMREDVSSDEEQFVLLKEEHVRCLKDLKLGKTSQLYLNLRDKKLTSPGGKKTNQEWKVDKLESLYQEKTLQR
ncbi:hypothetical protein ACROYT_G010635 [Oculina patagonica]